MSPNMIPTGATHIQKWRDTPHGQRWDEMDNWDGTPLRSSLADSMEREQEKRDEREVKRFRDKMNLIEENNRYNF